VSNIAILTFYWKSIYMFIFVKYLKIDLRLPSKDLGFEEKWGLEIWSNGLNPFPERFETLVEDLIRHLSITDLHGLGACITTRNANELTTSQLKYRKTKIPVQNDSVQLLSAVQD